ncbi:hypothetical protein VC83_08362 [Pseudogymnoascus destructans]|uniref:Major facilitator superfamily (MFS) profile domain-containing protein n=1 Tax=Pseudogymnoascus destructans TaxID=655981 RepID=A0A176ZZW8_9PEZI|nr:uncharacterized protein VC83_08362 [Pseudogymnoascus destructans]OAF55466.1 hypothetical protein VC83_08362 [Pseudogymnoascus destructans]
MDRVQMTLPPRIHWHDPLPTQVRNRSAYELGLEHSERHQPPGDPKPRGSQGGGKWKYNDLLKAAHLYLTCQRYTTIASSLPLLTGVMFLINFGAYMMTMPQSRIYEDIICHHYYDGLEGTSHPSLDTPIDESLCKVGPIHFWWLFLTSSIPSLLVSIPYGILADRIGRKPSSSFP